MDAWTNAPNVFIGIPVSPGIRKGKARVIRPKRMDAQAVQLEEHQVEGEIRRLEHAINSSIEQLELLKERIDRRTGENHYFILEAHQLMLRDESIGNEAARLIQENHFSAEWAVKVVVKRLARRFEAMDNEVFQRRASDVRDVGLRLFEHLYGDFVRGVETLGSDDLVIARSLSPGDATQFYRSPVQAIALETGGKASHIAIIAHSMEIPAVLGVKQILSQVADGDLVIVDGNHGVVVVNPDSGQLENFARIQRSLEERHARLQRDVHKPSVTADGVSVTLRANVESIEELPQLTQYGARGIGLFRTEFLFLDRSSPPGEDEHYTVYRQLLDGCTSGPITIRSADIGSDKLPPYWPSFEDGNPALGLRAVRTIDLSERYFVDQVRAVYRVALHGQVRFLLPFVSGVEEVRRVLALLTRVRADLAHEKIPFNPDVPVGIMVELPSAAIISDLLAREVDFFSIGTNDLVQYSLAVDRDAEVLSHLYTPLHPAILRMIRLTCENADKSGIPVSLCGEMASEPAYTPLLLGLGLTELTMTSGALPYVREVVRNTRQRDAQQLAQNCLACATAAEVEALIQTFVEDRFPENALT